MDKTLSKQVQEVIEKGSVYDKAVYWCTEYDQYVRYSDEPKITRYEAKKICQSIKTIDERREFNTYATEYEAYYSIAPTLYIASASYEATAEKAIGTYKLFLQLEATNTIIDGIIRYVNKKDKHASELLIEAVLKQDYRKIEAATPEIFIPKNEIKLDTSNTWAQLLKDIDEVKEWYTNLKSIVCAIEEYSAAHNNLRTLIPSMIQEYIDDAKRDYSEGVPYFSHRELLAKQAKGERITKQHRERAIFPGYDEVKVDKELKRFWLKRLSDEHQEAYEKTPDPADYV